MPRLFPRLPLAGAEPVRARACCMCVWRTLQHLAISQAEGTGGGGGDSKAEKKAKANAEAALARQVEVLGLLQPMRDAGLASDAAALQRAAQWCDDNGATALEDITSTGMADDFVRSLTLKPIPAKKLTAVQPLCGCSPRSSRIAPPPPAAVGQWTAEEGFWVG